MSKHYRAWQRLAFLGLSTIGLGVSFVGHSTILKSRNEGAWFAFGTLGLCALNAGVAIFGEAVKRRTLYELEKRP